jgi:hypothetical protein
MEIDFNCLDAKYSGSFFTKLVILQSVGFLTSKWKGSKGREGNFITLSTLNVVK